MFCLSLLVFGCVSCGSDEPIDSKMSKKEQMLCAAITPYVDNTVLPTYKGMADNAILMCKACDDILEAFDNNSLTSEMVASAGKYWNKSRAYWEKSEAFLYGPAADYNIDPHIDSWPLDKNAMDAQLASLRAGNEWNIDNNAGYGLLGFHAVEYLLFELNEDGTQSRTHSLNYKREELVYLATVAADLRNQCVYLEAAWAGTDQISEEKKAILEEAELSSRNVYGWMMKNAGSAGSVYKSYQEAAEDIINGCIDIADEVGNTKIGRPNNGASSEDKNYIESPYSLNSIVDFYDNIVSIQNAYEGSQKGDASISQYIKSVNSELDTKIKAKIEESKEAIKAIPEPFAKHATEAAADKAVVVVGTELVDLLEEALTEISKN